MAIVYNQDLRERVNEVTLGSGLARSTALRFRGGIATDIRGIAWPHDLWKSVRNEHKPPSGKCGALSALLNHARLSCSAGSSTVNVIGVVWEKLPMQP